MSSLASRRHRGFVLAITIGLLAAGCALPHRPGDAAAGDTNPVDGMVVEGGDTRVEAGDTGPMDGDVVPPDIIDAPIEEDTGACPGTQMLCGAMCFDLQVDPMHCGSCTTACGPYAHAQPTCAVGMCGFTCDAGFGDCDGIPSNGCEAPLNDATNCGACHNACSAGTPMCSAGAGGTFACSNGCGMSETLCSGAACVDLQTSVSNCGACGNVCSLANATAGCGSGRCTVASCTAGYRNCDGMANNGCETDITTPMNCGACGTMCMNATQATGVCNSGTCGLNCNTGYRNCDGMNANGCEIHVTNDVNNCGTCGMRCSFSNAAASCNMGSCVLGTCTGGFGNCDGNPLNGCETTFATNPNHCGACGNACPSGVCVSGTCRPPTSCYEIRMARSGATSGMYMIDPDGSGSGGVVNVFCDMATAGGGWTVIFDPAAMANFNVSNLDYTVPNDSIRMAATDVLIAFRGTGGVVVGTPARFPMPPDWRMASPFTYQNSDYTTAATIGGTSVSAVTLRYGYHDFGTDCASNWDPASSRSYGRVCIDGTNAPFYAAFDDSTGDFCQDSSQNRDTTRCSGTMRFTIAVR